MSYTTGRVRFAPISLGTGSTYAGECTGSIAAAEICDDVKTRNGIFTVLDVEQIDVSTTSIDVSSQKKSWPLLLLPVVQGASRTTSITALDAMAEVFSDETSATSAAAKRCAPHSHRKKGLTPSTRAPQIRSICCIVF